MGTFQCDLIVEMDRVTILYTHNNRIHVVNEVMFAFPFDTKQTQKFGTRFFFLLSFFFFLFRLYANPSIKRYS